MGQIFDRKSFGRGLESGEKYEIWIWMKLIKDA